MSATPWPICQSVRRISKSAVMKCMLPNEHGGAHWASFPLGGSQVLEAWTGDERDDFSWDDLCTEDCPKGCEADHKGEQ